MQEEPPTPNRPRPPPLDYGVRPPDRPIWVDVGLAGLPNRAAALTFFWIAIALAVLSIPAAFFFPLAILGVLFGLAAWWYWACIDWMDRYGGWK